MTTPNPSHLKKLNVGCGHFPFEGYLNVDIASNTAADRHIDLDVFPYPFEDGQFEEIFASHVLEHLKDPLATMHEWHRILAPGGLLTIKVPHFSRGFTNPDHKRGFDVSFPLYFDPEMPPWYCGVHFELERLRLHWNAQPYLKKYVLSPPLRAISSAVGYAIDTVANLHPMLFSRLFAFWVGGFDELEIRLRHPAA